MEVLEQDAIGVAEADDLDLCDTQRTFSVGCERGRGDDGPSVFPRDTARLARKTPRDRPRIPAPAIRLAASIPFMRRS
jgi:hypothetical protein